jgi:hypothetical protein
MSRKDYKAIAAILATCGNKPDPELVERLAKMFAADNPRFDVARFYKAAGVWS